ncbi:rhodanese-like domain-containing protein [Picrophilus oshimae]|uniref:Rhodanese-related sulfurtransferase n=1 Tax=Picrophilus torridus (strain ATCC 700027 / DSM 9790 / JCM 10055 / NBRC 100828 / KAW 2/3) TaxID=1122961 RepID=Q6L0U8_PICTO|nr:rhodanese-like domain-containing protein [Picrophilus oshimae]AAT43404.1 rhodanese-related sulfurtransferases [Picrophilus oshimae DSM 9789]SMD30286.1 Rhodanese-related sulfurtransferase [Picrophilus oshimae DSM 9789]
MFEFITDYFKDPENLEILGPKDVIESLKNKDAIIIDVRTKYEYSSGHIKSAINYPLGHEGDIEKEIPKNTRIILICKTGHRSRAAANRLTRMGYKNLAHLEGGMDNWKKQNFPVVK